MTRLLRCLACGELTEVGRERTACTCGRSVAWDDGTIIQIQGPARIMAPADDVTTVDGLPWVTVPEEPIVVRRAVASAA
jgi:hypothetical protein